MNKHGAPLLGAVLVAANALGLPRLHEVYYDAPGADAPYVFTEIFGCPGEDLTGFLLVGVDGERGAPYRTIDLSGAVIPGDGLLVIATSRAVEEALTARDFIADVDWQNGPDAVQLWSPLGMLADAVQYGTIAGRSLGEGTPSPDVGAGLSLTRDHFSTDRDDNGRDFQVSEPTPGRVGTSVPEPRTTLLLLLGVALAAFRASISPGSRAVSNSSALPLPCETRRGRARGP